MASDDVVILPAGTVLKLRGYPVELTSDTPVESALIKQKGLPAFLEWSKLGDSLGLSDSDANGYCDQSA